MKLTVIVLTYNEELHIDRCLASLAGLDARVLVVDSFSTDNTVDLALKRGAEVVENHFITQAKQFQWAMDNCHIDTEWVLRIDADETIDTVLTESIIKFISQGGAGCNGAIFNRKHIFLGRWVRYGGRYPLPMLRLFRNGFAHVEQRWMDEHIVLDQGKACILKGGFEDNNLNSVSWFVEKHNKYATREMVDIMLGKLRGHNKNLSRETGVAIRLKRMAKLYFYLKLPYFVRPTFYFLFRYFLQFGFLDGAKGFAYHFLQGFWYRALVDVKCMEVDLAWANIATDRGKVEALEQLSGYDLSEEL